MTAPLTILGGGPAGLAIAFYAARAGLPFQLFERAGSLGGLCRTFRCREHRYDSGAHRFHDRDSEITREIRSLLGASLRPVSAPSQIVDHGRFIDFPPTPLGLLRSGGVGLAGRIACEVVRARLRSGDPPRNFAEFAERQFGPSAARRYLLDYSEKLWGLPAARLSPDVATRRLDGMNVKSLLTEILRPKQKARHIDGDFLYPRDGYGAIAAALARDLPPDSIHLNAEVRALHVDRGRIHALDVGGRLIETHGRIVSTIPLTRLVEMTAPHLSEDATTAARRLRFRHVRIVFLRLDQERVSANASIYVPDPTLLVARVSEPRNRSRAMAPDGETSLVAEVPCFEEDPAFALADDELAARVVREIESIGLLRAERVIETRCHVLRNAYPVYALDYRTHVETLLSALRVLENLDTIGRAGAFFYSHLHDQMRFGRDYVSAALEAPAAAAASVG